MVKLVGRDITVIYRAYIFVEMSAFFWLVDTLNINRQLGKKGTAKKEKLELHDLFESQVYLSANAVLL